jgi:hypothetical protein
MTLAEILYKGQIYSTSYDRSLPMRMRFLMQRSILTSCASWTLLSNSERVVNKYHREESSIKDLKSGASVATNWVSCAVGGAGYLTLIQLRIVACIEGLRRITSNPIMTTEYVTTSSPSKALMASILPILGGY